MVKQMFCSPQIYEPYFEKTNFYLQKWGEMPFLSDKLADIDVFAHNKCLREGASQTTKKDYRLLLRSAVSDRNFEIWILIGEV